jgi:hypothetical protein
MRSTSRRSLGSLTALSWMTTIAGVERILAEIGDDDVAGFLGLLPRIGLPIFPLLAHEF